MSLKDSTNESLFRFADALQTPEQFHREDYVSHHKRRGTTIVIDNGSSHCRVGFANEEDPRLVFRNAIAKTRGKKGEADYTCIGNDIASVEAVRSSLKNQFDKNLVTNFVYQEQIFDYAFSHLGMRDEKSMEHPVVITEPVCNPSYCRGNMSELLFECYNVPSLAYGVDALFSAQHNYVKQDSQLQDALIISSGHQATHIIPVLDGRMDASHCKRINLGGMHSVSYLQRLLQLKYPDLQAYITPSRMQELVGHHCYVAKEYGAELSEWATGKHDKDYRVIQLPFNPMAGNSVAMDVSRELKEKQRKKKAREQLLKWNQKKREEKIATYMMQLEQLLQLQQAQETVDPEEFQLMLEEAGYDTVESLVQVVQRVQSSLETEQQKLASLVKSLSGDVSPVQEATVSEEWLQSLRERRKEILELKRQRQLKKQELGKRRSAASQNRMRIISQLGAEETLAGKKSKRNKEDTFGMNDDDWNVYRDISKNAGESDSEREDVELSEISKVLEKHDPAFTKLSSGAQGTPSDMAVYYQLVIGVERFRVPEIVFQPTMVGVDQCGVSDTIEFMLQYYPPDVQQRLVENVFVTGGNTLFPNFSDRIEIDLRAIRPFKSSFTVTSAEDKLLDAWHGGCTWANSPESSVNFVSRAEYDERGGEFFKEHTFSNLCSKSESKFPS